MDSELLRESLDAAFKLKKVMQKKGLLQAKAKCPKCGGLIQGRLAGKKQHMRFWCETTRSGKQCLMSMME